MGKKWVLMVVIILSVAFVCTIVAPIAFMEEKAQANVHPWADSYGTNYGDGFNSYMTRDSWSTYNNGWLVFSGVYYTNSGYYPSAHYRLSSAGWSSSAYFAKSAYTPYQYLSGNALFFFFGHGTCHSLRFRQTNGVESYLADYRYGNEQGAWYFLDDCRGLDDCKFALLLACETAKDWGNFHITGFMRCIRGTDIVVGFTGKPRWDVFINATRHYSPSFIWNTEFWRASQYFNNPSYSVSEACWWAKHWEYQHCNNFFYGCDTYQIWGAENDARGYIKTPGDGRIELPPGS